MHRQRSPHGNLSGGPTTFTLNPNADFGPSEVCTVTVLASQVTDQDASDPPDTMAANKVFSFTTEGVVNVCTLPFTHTYEIQGSGNTAAIPATVTTQGVVVGDFEGPTSVGLQGFYIQDATGDGNAATSDGMFVFTGNADNGVSLGDVVRVTGCHERIQPTDRRSQRPRPAQSSHAAPTTCPPH